MQPVRRYAGWRAQKAAAAVAAVPADVMEGVVGEGGELHRGPRGLAGDDDAAAGNDIIKSTYMTLANTSIVQVR